MQAQLDASIALAGTQQPLLDRSQLVPGILLTGVAMTHVWEVQAVEDDMLVIQKLPRPLFESGHVHQMAAEGRGYACRCGLRRQAIAEFTPLSLGRARVHLITVDGGEARLPKDMEIYAGLHPITGNPVVVSVEKGIWSQPVPLVPRLRKIWEIPEALTRAAQDAT